MSQEQPISQTLPTGVMLNAYPDSIGGRLSDIVDVLKRPEFKDTFSLFYILPTFFNSDLDRGFSIIDYGLNEELVTPEDLAELNKLNIHFKLDLVLNHLSVQSHQFQDLIEHGNESPYKDFFVDWNEFWHAHGTEGPDGTIIPTEEYLQKLFMRKPGLPILKVRFPDGSDRLYWNTFYQDVSYQELEPEDLAAVEGTSATKNSSRRISPPSRASLPTTLRRSPRSSTTPSPPRPIRRRSISTAIPSTKMRSST